MALNTVRVAVLLPSPDKSFDQLNTQDKIYLGMSTHSNTASTSLAKIQTILDNMFPFKNKLNLLKFLQALYKNTNVNIANNQPVVIINLNYLLNLAKFLTETEQEAVANYLQFRMVLQMIPLSGHTKLTNLLNEFQNGLKGTTGKKGRKEICAEATQKMFSLAVGHTFVKSTFHSDQQFRQAEIVFNNLKSSFISLIDSSNMSYFNKPLLKEETNLTKLCLGYPSWMNGSGEKELRSEYRGLLMNKSATFLEQNIAVNQWAVKKAYGIHNQQLRDKDNCEWTEFSGGVGAYNFDYSVYLPLGIMQLPFYSILMPTALIYGKLGSILGHEIVHGLAGTVWSKLKNGRLTPSGKCLVKQYSNFSAVALRRKNVALNGKNTLRENISDNAGLLGAYKAFTQSTLLKGNDNGDKKEWHGGFTDDQLFFLRFAQNWCESMTEISLRKSLEKDTHPPGMFRVLGSLQNSYEFAKAWKCPVGSQMNPFPKDHWKCQIF